MSRVVGNKILVTVSGIAVAGAASRSSHDKVQSPLEIVPSCTQKKVAAWRGCLAVSGRGEIIA